MARARLDPAVVGKIADKACIKRSSVKRMAARRATRLGVTSDAALVLWARELGIGTAGLLKKLDPEVQAQVQGAAPVAKLLENVKASKGSPGGNPKARQNSPRTERETIKAVLPFVLTDSELRKRCADLLTAQASFDRVLREASTVLETRLRRRTRMSKRQESKTMNMLSRALNPSAGAVLRVSPHNDEQEGFYFLVRGVFATFRNDTHHQVTDNHTRWDALRLCGFVDYLLAEIEDAELTSTIA